MLTATGTESAAIRERLAVYRRALLPEVYLQLKEAASDQVRERLTALRYRLVAGDSLALNWSGGLERFCNQSRYAGRFAGQCDRFIQRRLEVNRYDRLVVPGGAAWLVDPEQPSFETPAARSALEMLVDIHALKQVVLIAHEGCGYSLSKLKLPPERCLSR